MSDIDIAVADSLKVLDLNGRLEKRTLLDAAGISHLVESRTGAVAGGLRPSLRFPSSLIELDVPISGIQLCDQFHREAFDAAIRGRRSRRSKLHSPYTTPRENLCAPRPATLCRLARKSRTRSKT